LGWVWDFRLSPIKLTSTWTLASTRSSIC
jgi:hypothetical protein